MAYAPVPSTPGGRLERRERVLWANVRSILFRNLGFKLLALLAALALWSLMHAPARSGALPPQTNGLGPNQCPPNGSGR